jgi:hypothetical protein
MSYNEYTAAVKTMGEYTLEIVHDPYPRNPRKDDNLGKMICWHREYRLGDEHNREDSAEMLADLIRHTISENDIIAYAKSSKTKGPTLRLSRSGREWQLKVYDTYFKKRHVIKTYTAPLPNNYTVLSEDILDEMREDDLLCLARTTHLILPLWFYANNSTIGISTESFVGRAHHADWDSGQVGWVYVSHADIAKEYGDASEASIEKAADLIESETKAYNFYLNGECYGYVLYKKGEEIDSYMGFLGDFKDAKDAIRNILPDEARVLAETIEYGDDDRRKKTA